MSKPIAKLLIANRGEIACRIIRSCRQLNIATVAVYSAADAQSQHVALADEAHYLGGARPSESYLNGEAILAAAKASGADAIHPGYGFLSENPAFVRDCEAAGLIFVGPSAATMQAMGSKADAKAAMEKAGVPTVPGYHGRDQSDKTLAARAKRIGFPLMIKAAAGGGGKGMRIVETTFAFSAALAAARRESMNAFGDDRVILERYLREPRHIEVQIFGDRQGSVVHLFERDCSSQRRYQKVIEESPAPSLDEGPRSALCEAAVKAAQAVQYVNAGTVEFIVNQSGEFFFMEMNTRLQVEHPVTEAITGLDLVAWQLHIASGGSLPLQQGEIIRLGHAFEARIYAEDPAHGFLPASGKITSLQWPTDARIDTGVAAGDDITVHYDPMIAKLVVHGNDRAQALSRLRQALRETAVLGIRCNLDFLLALASSARFIEGAMHTAFLDTSMEALLPTADPSQDILLAAGVAQLLTQEKAAVIAQAKNRDPHSPWAEADGWRLGHFGRRVLSLRLDSAHYAIEATGFAGHYQIRIGEQAYTVADARSDATQLGITVDGTRHRYHLVCHPPYIQVAGEQRLFIFVAENPFATEASESSQDNRLTAPMPGRIVAVKCAPDERVSEGQELIVMEAMKMELSLTAPLTGVVSKLKVDVGAFVEADALLVEIEP